MTQRNHKKKPALKAVASVKPKVDCCAKCHFFLEQEPSQGLCRRYPATPIFTGHLTVGMFPTMLNEGWCGEFKAKQTAEDSDNAQSA